RVWLRTPWAGRARPAAVAALCAAPAVAAEVLLLGAPWPAVRAGMGAGLALCADVLGRRTDGLTALFAAAAGCALLDPAATHDLALQLSVAGVAGMLVLAEPVRDFFPRPLPRIPLPRRAGDLASRVAEHGLRLACATGRAAFHARVASDIPRRRARRCRARAAPRRTRVPGRRRRRSARARPSGSGRRFPRRAPRACRARGVAARRGGAHASTSGPRR